MAEINGMLSGTVEAAMQQMAAAVVALSLGAVLLLTAAWAMAGILKQTR